MARGTTQVKNGFCKQCNKSVKTEKNATVWGVGDLVMVMLTAGGWLVLKLISNGISNPWRCYECGCKL